MYLTAACMLSDSNPIEKLLASNSVHICSHRVRFLFPNPLEVFMNKIRKFGGDSAVKSVVGGSLLGGGPAPRSLNRHFSCLSLSSSSFHTWRHASFAGVRFLVCNLRQCWTVVTGARRLPCNISNNLAGTPQSKYTHRKTQFCFLREKYPLFDGDL